MRSNNGVKLILSAPSDSNEGKIEIQESLSDENILDKHPLAKALNSFLIGMSDFRNAVDISISEVKKRHDDDLKKNLKILAKCSDEIVKEKENKTRVHTASKFLDSIYIIKRLTESHVGQVLERSLFVGLFSEFDVFIGNLMSAVYEKKPELFKEIRREITLSDLLEFESVDAVKKNILEKEIDSFRRESYIEQFVALEKKFKISTLRDFPEWPQFVEIGQRRNLMTHNGGSVSEQYILNCKKEGYRFETVPKVGDTLELGTAYFSDAIQTLSKVAFMLVHTLWRKLLSSPKELEAANTFLNSTLYLILKQRDWKLAAEFGSFGLNKEIVKTTLDLDLRIRVINTAIAVKKCGRLQQAIQMLDAIDWSASIREFKLANAVLRDDFVEAKRIMKDIGKHGELVGQMSYHEWPLFYDFRETVEFQDAYFELYKVPFSEKVSEEIQAAVGMPESTSTSTATVSGSKDVGSDAARPRRTRRTGQASASKSETESVLANEVSSAKKSVSGKESVLEKEFAQKKRGVTGAATTLKKQSIKK